MNSQAKIFGIGTDLCSVTRIEAVLQRQGERFAQRILTPTELAVYQSRKLRNPARSVRYLASRFAAKEALSKAIHLGLRMPMCWHNCEVVNDRSGAPVLGFLNALDAFMQARNLRAHLSLTDETDMAAAFVVVEQFIDQPA